VKQQLALSHPFYSIFSFPCLFLCPRRSAGGRARHFLAFFFKFRCLLFDNRPDSSNDAIRDNEKHAAAQKQLETTQREIASEASLKESIDLLA
jgi:hypothetical protein